MGYSSFFMFGYILLGSIVVHIFLDEFRGIVAGDIRDFAMSKKLRVWHILFDVLNLVWLSFSMQFIAEMDWLFISLIRYDLHFLFRFLLFGITVSRAPLLATVFTVSLKMSTFYCWSQTVWVKNNNLFKNCQLVDSGMLITPMDEVFQNDWWMKLTLNTITLFSYPLIFDLEYCITNRSKYSYTWGYPTQRT